MLERKKRGYLQAWRGHLEVERQGGYEVVQSQVFF